MPRRSILTDAQRAALLALPEEDTLLTRYWTLSPDDLRLIASRRRAPNRLGFALQLCALRYPGRLLKPGDLIPQASLSFVGDQLEIDPETLIRYAVRTPTRYEQLDTLRQAFDFQPLIATTQTELQDWLLPVALVTTSGVAVAKALVDEIRRRHVVIPGIGWIERMVGKAMLDAERHVVMLLTRDLTAPQRDKLDGFLQAYEDTHLSRLSWIRQPPGAPGRRAFAAILDRLATVRSIDLDADLVSAIHPERLRRLCQEGTRLTAQHLAARSVTRRRAVLVATAIETRIRLTDDVVQMFDRLFGQLFRRVERREEAALKRDRRTINGKLRLLARIGDAFLAAQSDSTDLLASVQQIMPWDAFETEIAETHRLIRPDVLDPVELARSNAPILRQIGPNFVAVFTFGSVPPCVSLLKAIEVMRALGSGRIRKLPPTLSLGFIRSTWRQRLKPVDLDQRMFEFCVLAELRDRLRAGDEWVEGSRRYRAAEQQLLHAQVFAEMRAAHPVPTGSISPSIVGRRLQVLSIRTRAASRPFPSTPMSRTVMRRSIRPSFRRRPGRRPTFWTACCITVPILPSNGIILMAAVLRIMCLRSVTSLASSLRRASRTLQSGDCISLQG